MVSVNGDRSPAVIDIRRDGVDTDLLDCVRTMLNPKNGQERRLPTLLLYDEQGLKLFEDITYLDEYYLTNAEIDVLTNHANDLANQIHTDSLIVELGSGYERDSPCSVRAFMITGYVTT